jgi:L-fuconolactonase
MMKKLDCHMHIWRLQRGDYDWLTPDLASIYRDFEIKDVWDEAQASGVAQVILVQAAASAAETDYLLNVAETDERIAGVVGWVDFEAGDAAEQITRRADNPNLLGLRPMIADLSDPLWILQDACAPALESLQANGLVFDAHAHPDLVPVMTRLATRYPNLSIVLNHAGKPPIASAELDVWRCDIEDLARHANVSCKLSGLLTEAGARTDDAAISEVVEHIGASFGPERLLWGSDWPVLTLAGNYTDWAAQCERLVDQYYPDHSEAIFSGNAKRIYSRNAGV